MNDIGKNKNRPGAVLKAIRLEKGLTLAEVSKLVDLPVSSLSKVENDRMSLSYDKLAKISRGLQVDISRLFGDRPSPQEGVIGRRSINLRGQGHIIETESYLHSYLSTDLLHKAFIPIMGEVLARSLDEFDELIEHAGEEFTLVLEGALELHTNLYAPVRLEAGESIYFDSSMGHAYVAVSEGPCRVLTICTGEEAQMMSSSSKKPSAGAALHGGKRTREKTAKKPAAKKRKRATASKG